MLFEEVTILCICLFNNLSGFFKKTINNSTFYQMLHNDVLYIFFGNTTVHCTLGISYNDWTFSTKTETSCLNDFYFIL